MIKHLLSLFITLSVVASARGQHMSAESVALLQTSVNQSPLIINGVQRQHYKIPRLPGERMIKVGRTLTIIGSVVAIGGVIMYSQRDPDYYRQTYQGGTYYDVDTDPKAILGQALFGLGVGMIVPGVLVWTRGVKTHRRYLEKNSQSLYIPAGKVGVGYRF